MRISDWSSDVCSSDLIPRRSTLASSTRLSNTPTTEGNGWPSYGLTCKQIDRSRTQTVIPGLQPPSRGFITLLGRLCCRTQYFPPAAGLDTPRVPAARPKSPAPVVTSPPRRSRPTSRRYCPQHPRRPPPPP